MPRKKQPTAEKGPVRKLVRPEDRPPIDEIAELKAKLEEHKAEAAKWQMAYSELHNEVVPLRAHHERQTGEITELTANIDAIRQQHDDAVKEIHDGHKTRGTALRGSYQAQVTELHEKFIAALAPLREETQNHAAESKALSRQLGRADATIKVMHPALAFYQDAVSALAKDKLDRQKTIANMNTLITDRGSRAKKAADKAQEYLTPTPKKAA